MRIQFGPSPWQFFDFWALGTPFVLGFILKLEGKILNCQNMTYIDNAQKILAINITDILAENAQERDEVQ